MIDRIRRDIGVVSEVLGDLRIKDVQALSSRAAKEMLGGGVVSEAMRMVPQFRIRDILRDEWHTRNDMLREIESLVRAPNLRDLCGHVADIAAEFRREQALSEQVLRETKLSLSPYGVVADVAALLRPLESMRGTWEMPDVLRDVLGSMKAADALLRIHGPIVSMESAAAVAALWGDEGVRRQLSVLGILDFDAPDETDKPEARIHIPAPDFWNLISLILALLVPLLQEWKAARDGAVLNGRIDELHAAQLRQKKQLDAIEHLLHQALAEKRARNVCYVTRERSAKVRESSEPGARVIATVFPNQVVTLIERRGKWILVEYYDWLSQETMTGWVLKKYLQRMPSC